MRDHFDPLAPLLYHNHEVERDDTLAIIARHNSQQEHRSNGLQASSDNKFDLDSINSVISGVSIPATDIICSLNTPENSSSTGTKRRASYCNSDSNNVTDTDELEFLDCNMLQSSLKRVRLSRCPGEFRLQRDLKTLDPRKWQPENDGDENASTNIHRSTLARLTVVDALRICLSLPNSASGTASTMTGCQNQRRFHSHHCDYQWKIIIQIPRMYPHRPPVVSRIEGLSIDHIIINDLPPNKKSTLLPSSSSPTTTAMVKQPVLLSLAQQDHHRTNEPSIDLVIGMKTIIWNEWSPIIGLGELLDFILEVAAANTKNIHDTTILAGNNPTVDQRMSSTTKKIFATTTAPYVTMSSSSCDSSVSSASSFSQGRRLNNSGDLFSSHNTMTMTDEITNSSTTNNVNTISFLSPNRFDVGYGKFDTTGYEKYNNNPTSFAAATATLSDNTTTSIATSCHGQSQQYREKGEDEIEMDIC